MKTRKPVLPVALEELYTLPEVAAYLKVDVSTVRRMLGRGDLTPVRVGIGRGQVRVALSSLASYTQGVRAERREPIRLSLVPRPQPDFQIDMSPWENSRKSERRSRAK